MIFLEIVSNCFPFTHKCFRITNSSVYLGWRSEAHRELNVTDLNVPVPVPHVVQPQLVRDLGGVHGVGQVLLVGEHQHHRVPQLVLSQHPE